MQARARSVSRAMGFSQKIAFPARAAASMPAACRSVGVAMTTASTSGAAMISSPDARRAPVARATSSLRGVGRIVHGHEAGLPESGRVRRRGSARSGPRPGVRSVTSSVFSMPCHGGVKSPGNAGTPFALVIPAKAGIHAFRERGRPVRIALLIAVLRASGPGPSVRCGRDTCAPRAGIRVTGARQRSARRCQAPPDRSSPPQSPASRAIFRNAASPMDWYAFGSRTLGSCSASMTSQPS